MRTNCDCTVYVKSIVNRAEKWTRHVIPGVHWENVKAANVIKSGLLEADSVSVYIPLHNPALVEIRPEDVLVKGAVTDEITGLFTITALKAKYPNVVAVRSVDRFDYGSKHLQHVRIGAA